MTSDSTLPYCIGDFVLTRGRCGNREAGKEEHVNQGVDELLPQRSLLSFAIDKLITRGILALFGVKEHLRLASLSGTSVAAPWRPEESILPLVEVFHLIKKGQKPCENAYAVQRMPFGCDFWIWEGTMVP